MAQTYQSILSNTKGRFIGVTVENSKFPRTTASVKVVRLSPKYVTLREYSNGVSGDVKFHRNSIKKVTANV